eukprot:12668144-Heterocapsa_arctica.AAC.1
MAPQQSARRWHAVGTRRPDFQGAAQGIDEGTSFRLPRKSWSGEIRGAFGRFVCMDCGKHYAERRDL